MSLPRNEAEADEWLSRMLDGYVPKLGQSGWRRKILQGRSVSEIMANGVDTKSRNVYFKMPVAVAQILSRYVLRSGKSRARYVRDALRLHLIEREGMDPDEWPE